MDNIARLRKLLHAPQPIEQDADQQQATQDEPDGSERACPCCGGRMITIEVFQAGQTPRHQPVPEGIDSS